MRPASPITIEPIASGFLVRVVGSSGMADAVAIGTLEELADAVFRHYAAATCPRCRRVAEHWSGFAHEGGWTITIGPSVTYRHCRPCGLVAPDGVETSEWVALPAGAESIPPAVAAELARIRREAVDGRYEAPAAPPRRRITRPGQRGDGGI